MKKLLHIIPLLIILHSVTLLGASSPTYRLLSGNYMAAGNPFRAIVTIEPSENNRALQTELDCEDVYKSSWFEGLNAESSKFYSVIYRDIPPGKCYFIMNLFFQDQGELQMKQVVSSEIVVS